MTAPSPSALLRKAAGAEPLFPTGRLLKRSLLDAEQEVASARQHAADIRAEAQRLLEEARAQAESCRAEARAAAEAERRTEIDRCLQSLSRAADDADRRAAEALAACVFPVAAAVLEAELTAHPERLIGLVAAALRASRADGPVKLELHPHDAEIIRPRLTALPDPARLELIENPQRPRFSALVETPDGLYEGGLHARLRLLEDAARRAAAEEAAP